MVLRNVVPRQGTEITVLLNNRFHLPIEKCSSPTGDGNGITGVCYKIVVELLRNVVPRQGTEIAY